MAVKTPYLGPPVRRRQPKFRQLGAANITVPPKNAHVETISELTPAAVKAALEGGGSAEAKFVRWDPSLSGPIYWGDADNVVLTNAEAGNTFCEEMPPGVYIVNDGSATTELIQIGSAVSRVENFHMQGWRFRLGDAYNEADHSGKAKMLYLANCRNVRISHCSFWFCIDNEQIGSFGDSERITYDNNIIAYGLMVADKPQDEVFAGTEDHHSRALSIQAKAGELDTLRDVSILYNLYVGCHRRNPGNVLGASPVDFRYNYCVLSGAAGSGARIGSSVAMGMSRATCNYVGNEWVASDSFTTANDLVYATGSQTAADVGAYFNGNVFPAGLSLNDDLVSNGMVEDDEFPVAGPTVRPPRHSLRQHVTQNAGPSVRDKWDQLAISQARSTVSSENVDVINNPEDLGAQYEPAPNQ